MSGNAFFAALSWNWTFWSGLVGYGFACLGAGLLTMLALGGARAVRTHEVPSAQLAVALLLGLGLLAQLWTLLALGSIFLRPLVYTIVVFLILAAVALVWPQRQALLRTLRERRLALRRERLGIRMLLITAWAWLVFTFTALGRPFSGDSLALHMMIPKMAASAGTLERNWFQPGNEFFGILGEMTYAGFMQLGNEDAAQMSTWAIVFALAILLMGVCTRVGIGLRGRTIAVAALSSTTAVLIWIGEGKIDLIASALGLAALYLLIPRPDLAPLPRGNLMIAGLLAGFAITAKLMLAFCIAAASAVLLFWTYAPASLRSWQPWRNFNIRSFLPMLGAGLLFGAFVLIGLAPHFIKNWMLLDLPFAPLGTDHTAFVMQDRWYDNRTIRQIRLMYPIILTFGDYFAQYGQLSVLVLAFMPLTLFLWRPASFWHSPLTAVTAAAWIAISGWTIVQGDKVVMRYILPTLLLFIPLAAAAAERVTARSFRPRILGTAVISASFATIGIVASHCVGFYYFPERALKVMFASAPPCDRGLQWCLGMYMVSRAAPEGSRVFSAASFKYDMRADLIQCSYDHRTVAFPGNTPEERWRWFYNQGYSYMLPDPVHNPGYPLLSDLQNPPPWVNILRYRPDDPMGLIYVSYDLTKGGPSVRPEVSCQRTPRGAWKIVRTGN